VIWRGWWFLPLNVAAGAVVFLLTLRLASVFDIDDQSRLLSLRSFVPSALRGLYERAIAFLVPAKARPAIS
jgi:hypothetical protein